MLPTSARVRVSEAGEPPGQAEIDDLDPSFGSEQQVARLQIAVDEVAIVGGLQSGRDLPPPFACARHRLRAVVVDELLEVAPGNQFEHKIVHCLIRTGSGEHAGVERGNDVRVIERRQRLHFRAEALQEFLRDRIVHRQDLERDAPAEQDVLAQEDDCRAAAAKPIEDAVSAEHEPGGVVPDHAIALVVGEQAGHSQCGGGPLTSRQARQLVRGPSQEAPDRG